jgi:hypothetical protein
MIVFNEAMSPEVTRQFKYWQTKTIVAAIIVSFWGLGFFAQNLGRNYIIEVLIGT